MEDNSGFAAAARKRKGVSSDPRDNNRMDFGKYKYTGFSYLQVERVDPDYCSWVKKQFNATGPLLGFRSYLGRVKRTAEIHDTHDEGFTRMQFGKHRGETDFDIMQNEDHYPDEDHHEEGIARAKVVHATTPLSPVQETNPKNTICVEVTITPGVDPSEGSAISEQVAQAIENELAIKAKQGDCGAMVGLMESFFELEIPEDTVLDQKEVQRVCSDALSQIIFDDLQPRSIDLSIDECTIQVR